MTVVLLIPEAAHSTVGISKVIEIWDLLRGELSSSPVALDAVNRDRPEPRPEGTWSQAVLKLGKALEQCRENFLHDVISSIWLRYEPADPAPDQGLIKNAELIPRLGIFVAEESIQKAERGINAGHG